MELRRLALARYPDLLPHQAIFRFCRDHYELIPKRIRSQLPEIGEAVRTVTGCPPVVFLSQIAAMLRGDTTNESPSGMGDPLRGQIEVLENLQSQLKNYQRLEVCGQLAAFSTFAAAVCQIKRLADRTERVAGFMKGIEQNLTSSHIRGAYFLEHVHSYVRLLIERHSSDTVPHYVTVFNNSDLWHPKFADIQRRDSLGPTYLGHKADLDELCAFLAEEVRPQVGPVAVLHILMPTAGPLSLEEAIRFPEAMRPFEIDGQTGDGGAKFVYICAPEARDHECLSGVGVLKQREIWKMGRVAGDPLPMPVKPFRPFFIDPKFKLSIYIPWNLGSFGTVRYYSCGLEPPRTLGQPTARPWS